jgi:hypothetical protein
MTASIVGLSTVNPARGEPMRIVSRTARSIREQQREKSIRKREAAGTLATAFPRAEFVRIHLHFVSDGGPALSPRTHALYASADAYFEFACPHGDCDASIDLNDAARALLRKGDMESEGTLHCPGTRTGDGTVRPRCNQRVDYWIVARYRQVTRAAS